MLGDRENSWAMVGIAMDSDTRSIRLTMVNAKMIAKIRQRTLLALVVPVSGAAAAAGWTTAPGRLQGSTGTSHGAYLYLLFLWMTTFAACMAALVSTIEGSVITV